MSEKAQQNAPERCSCCTCGYTWVKGQHGGHSCAQVMEVTVADLRARLAKYEDAEGNPISTIAEQAREIERLTQHIEQQDDAYALLSLDAGRKMDELEQELAASSPNHSEQVREWVPVSERLPDEHKAEYLCLFDAGHQQVTEWLHDETEGWCFWYGDPTHWMPLPAAPSAGSQEQGE